MRGLSRHRDTLDSALWPALILTAALCACREIPAGEPLTPPVEPKAASATRARNDLSPRDRALARAHVWREPEIPIEKFDFLHNAGRLKAVEELNCRLVPEAAGGTTSKFDCVLSDGDVVKVKYGGTPEIPSEVAASRLLAALGFGSDEVSIVPTVRCLGCPRAPFDTLRALDERQALQLYRMTIDLGVSTEFHDVAVEQKFAGRNIKDEDESEGWAWWELDRVDASRGGAPRAHVDALRLVAVFLAHWDNKAPNQRLVCPGAEQGADEDCAHPLAIIHDAGATFGPVKADLAGWREMPIWVDEATCLVSMKALPHGGATFPDAQISEAGRRFLAERLTKLSDTQIRHLFVGARFATHQPFYNSADGADPDRWVEVFKNKVRAIADRPACPLLPGAAPSGAAR